ncbi:hypothetical protein [Kitasatospora sp. NBC_00315]|uniref:hypothetical protein n=1 Tax=Kitasatospora sp. NBC_00315 TaxID=2975963 RepID=UPI003245F86D
MMLVPAVLICEVGFQLWPWGGAGAGWGWSLADLGTAAAGAALAWGLDRGPLRGRTGTEARRAAAATAATVLCLTVALSATGDAVHEWQAVHIPTVPVTATLDGCYEFTRGDTGNTTVDRCRYHWSYQGLPRQEERDAAKPYPDGHAVTARMDPTSGNLVATGLGTLVFRLVISGFLSLAFLGSATMMIVCLPEWLRRIRSGP